MEDQSPKQLSRGLLWKKTEDVSMDHIGRRDGRRVTGWLKMSW